MICCSDQGTWPSAVPSSSAEIHASLSNARPMLEDDPLVHLSAKHCSILTFHGWKHWFFKPTWWQRCVLLAFGFMGLHLGFFRKVQLARLVFGLLLLVGY